ncbi:MAG: cysteine desulfurase family protein [Nitrosomonas sp.]|nr:cysteine desulfurase family protein [Nitrosomonas sp.]
MTVYLDCNATTPLDPRVAAVMKPWFCESFGNHSSRDHHLGWDAAEAVEDARCAVAEIIHAQTSEIIFNSGATEGLNAVIKGFVGYQDWEQKKIITCSTEHDAVLMSCQQLAKTTGIEVQVLPVNGQGHIDLEQLVLSLHSHKNLLVVLMLANNELGTIHPIAEIARIVHNAGALLLSDITQAVGKFPVSVYDDGIDVAVFSAHKIYGPKGVGALFIRGGESKIEIEPLIVGGGQEQGMRGGTLNVPGIVGLGEACRIAQLEYDTEAESVMQLRNRLEQALMVELSNVWVNGDGKNRIPNTSNIYFGGVDARILIRDMHDIAVSTRAACSSGESGPSHVLKAIGLTDEEAHSCVRFSLGRFTTEDEINYAINKVITSVSKLRR